MSILIMNMKMPTKQVCVILNPNGLVEVLDANNVLLEEFQAIELPSHGRCIDTSKLPWYLVDLTEILEAPTIIPAEGNLENEIHIIDNKGKPNYNPKYRFVISSPTIIPTEGGDVNGEI